MVRINLLPTEIIERRKYEGFYPYIFLAGGVLLGIVLLSWLGLQLLVNQRENDLQQTQETVKTLNEQAEALAIFEQQQAALEERQAVVTQALAARVDHGKILEEVSLVLPDSVWLESVTLNQETGAVIQGYTPDSVDAEIGESYKSLAATLVRLNSLSDLYDVWLTTAESEEYGDFQGVDGALPLKAVAFETSAKILRPETAVPAPPATAGQ